MHISEEKMQEFYMDLLVSMIFQDESYDQYLSYKSKKKLESEPLRSFTKENYLTVIANRDLIDLVELGVLSDEFPYTINGSSDVFEELKFYEIMDGDNIGEIGAGNGMFSFILAMMNENIEIHTNEIRSVYLDYLEHKIIEYRHLLFLDHIKTHLGTKKRTQFYFLDLDKIIIRNSFHHFSNKKRMLESIRHALVCGGQLYILEYPKEYEIDPSDTCNKFMSVAKIKKVLKANKFSLVEEKRMGEALLLHYVPAPK